jgi:hypothetical protein
MTYRHVRLRVLKAYFRAASPLSSILRIDCRAMDEHDFEGGITIVKDYIFAARQRQRETIQT